MQSTIQPPAPAPPSPAEFLTGYALRIHRAQSDALDILHRVMIQAARLLEDPPLEKPYQTRATNERMRIAMRTAATIINMRLPKAPPASPPPSPTKPGRVDRAKREEPEDKQRDLKDGSLNTEAPRGHVTVPCSSPSTPASTIQAAAATAPLAQPPAPSKHVLAHSTPTATTTLITAATASPLPTDQPSATPFPASPIHPPHFDLFDPFVVKTAPPPLPSSVPSVSSVFQSPLPPLPSSAPSVSSVVNPPPPLPLTPQASRLKPPPDLTQEELALLTVRKAGIYVSIPFELSDRLRQWHVYTDATGIKPPFEITAEQLLPPPRKRKRRRFKPPD